MEANERAHTALSYGVTAPYTENGRRQDRNVRFFDFDDLSVNTFGFAQQVSIKGPRQDIVPDIIVYVNGLPLAVIECKSPVLADPMGEATLHYGRCFSVAQANTAKRMGAVTRVTSPRVFPQGRGRALSVQGLRRRFLALSGRRLRHPPHLLPLCALSPLGRSSERSTSWR